MQIHTNQTQCFHHTKQESDNCWWDSFATEFFEDDATLTLLFMLEDGPKRYSEFFVCTRVWPVLSIYMFLNRIAIGRTLIPRYFRSIFEGGVTELYFHMRHNKESFQQTSVTLDCEQCTMITNHGKPMLTKVRFFLCLFNLMYENDKKVNMLGQDTLYCRYVHKKIGRTQCKSVNSR